MRILNKNNIKWWGTKDKKETWTYKQNGDWWVIKPEKENEAFLPRKQKNRIKRKGEPLRHFWIASCIGALLGVGLFSLGIIYLLIKNAL